MDEIAAACTGLGTGDCKKGGMENFKEGLSIRRGSGTGAPGKGYGARDTGSEEETSEFKTRVDSKTKPGPAVASWLFKGKQVRGEASRELSETVQVAKDRAAEAINENRIPRRYEGPVKKYFGNLEQESNK